jgi:thiamine-monophosphate kinase
VNEFELIDEIVRVLGEAASGGVIGPGDDGAVIEPPPGEVLVSSIDTLVGGFHFPMAAPGALVGYRAMMVSLSDLAAMGARPFQVLVAMTLEEADQAWALEVAEGMREAVLETEGRLLGGNLARGSKSLTMSVHGFCPRKYLLTRSGAGVGDSVYVTGELGAAAAAVALGRLDDPDDPLTRRYFRPRARIEEGIALRGVATAAIDVSDGLLQDLDHLCEASGGIGAELSSAYIPVADGASLDHALHGGDDYELLFSARTEPDLDCRMIGTIAADPGIRLDGAPVAIKGYQHFL